jgi:DNA-directed RNA polymerase subunit RPC12/RpoP
MTKDESWNIISRLNGALEKIGDYAHDKSAGPAVPDALWEIRSMAYDAIEEATLPAQPAPVQEPVGEAYLCDKCQTPFDGAYYCPSCGHNTATKENVYTTPPAQPEERNFCSRCGKRTRDLTAIHTCTPPQDEISKA